MELGVDDLSLGNKLECTERFVETNIRISRARNSYWELLGAYLVKHNINFMSDNNFSHR